MFSISESNSVNALHWEGLGKKADGKSFSTFDFTDFVWCSRMYSLCILLWCHVPLEMKLCFPVLLAHLSRELLAREVVESPSLEIFKTRLDVVLCSPL